ncbi:MAG: diguanylate cyclase, partial [Pseudomonadota bacterium]
MEKAKILLVDDRKENLIAIEAILEGPEIDIFQATSGNEALGLLLEHEFALVLLDVQMPEMDGFEMAEIMRKKEKTMQTPIIFVTAISKEQSYIFTGYEKGAVDYLFKPLDEHVLRSKVSVFLSLYRQKSALQRAYAELNTTVDELRNANKKILVDQRTLIEEERLRLLLQLAGATAHEMNQPLTAILTGLDLLKIRMERSEDIRGDLDSIKLAGKTLRNIVRKIQGIRRDEIRPYLNTSIINPDQAINVLSIEDDKNYFNALSAMLQKDPRIKLTNAQSISEAKKVLAMPGLCDVILLDHVLPDGDSFSVFSLLKKKGREVPVIVLTGQGDEVVAAQVIKQGAADYLPKMDASRETLLESISGAIEQHRLKQDLKKTMDTMADMATRDSLTGLFNRRYFLEALEREVLRARRYKADLSLCLLDIDYFKRVNDTYGHQAGDAVLSGIGAMMKRSMRTSDCLCRYGGEEFAIIFPNTASDNTYRICERFRQMIDRHSFTYETLELHCSVSIGISSIVSSETDTLSGFVEQADKALF